MRISLRKKLKKPGKKLKSAVAFPDFLKYFRRSDRLQRYEATLHKITSMLNQDATAFVGVNESVVQLLHAFAQECRSEKKESMAVLFEAEEEKLLRHLVLCTYRQAIRKGLIDLVLILPQQFAYVVSSTPNDLEVCARNALKWILKRGLKEEEWAKLSPPARLLLEEQLEKEQSLVLGSKTPSGNGLKYAFFRPYYLLSRNSKIRLYKTTEKYLKNLAKMYGKYIGIDLPAPLRVRIAHAFYRAVSSEVKRITRCCSYNSPLILPKVSYIDGEIPLEYFAFHLREVSKTGEEIRIDFKAFSHDAVRVGFFRKILAEIAVEDVFQVAIKNDISEWRCIQNDKNIFHPFIKRAMNVLLREQGGIISDKEEFNLNSIPLRTVHKKLALLCSVQDSLDQYKEEIIDQWGNYIAPTDQVLAFLRAVSFPSRL